MAKSPIEHQLKPLREELRGHYSRCARAASEKLGKKYLTSDVTRILDGVWSNLDVVNVCVSVRDEIRKEAQERKREEEKLVKRIKA